MPEAPPVTMATAPSKVRSESSRFMDIVLRLGKRWRTSRSGKEVTLPPPPPLRTGQAPFRCIRLKHETTHLSQHAANLIGLEAACTLREQSRLPTCLGGGSRTSKDRYGPADISACCLTPVGCPLTCVHTRGKSARLRGG